MFDIAFLILFCVMAYRIATGIFRESKIFEEFKQPRTLAFLVMLFPFASFVLFVGIARLPFYLAYFGAAACFIPALIISHRLGLAFEVAGTDRVKDAKKAVSQAFGTAIAGLIYVALNFIFAISVAAIR